MIERGEERRGGRGSLALAKLQKPALVLARYLKLHSKRQSRVQAADCLRRLTAYVGHFYQVTCVTHCMLEVGE